MRVIAAMGLMAALVGCSSSTALEVIEGPNVRLETVWRTAGFAQPESVTLSADKTILYVTNVDGDGAAADGKGSIATVDAATGKILDADWVSGLDAPKGIDRMGERLYVADIDEIVVVDLLTAAIVERHPVQDAQFLNDVAVLSDGTVLVSDSRAGRIHQLLDGVVSVFVEGPDLARVNGIFPADRHHVIVVTMEGKLLDIDRFSREIRVLAEGLDQADGVVPLRPRRYLVTAWPGLLQVVEGDGSHAVLLDTRAVGRSMNDGVRADDMFYQTHMRPGELTAYRITETAQGGAPSQK
jgi:glucose/arabinose dehydrogenase